MSFKYPKGAAGDVRQFAGMGKMMFDPKISDRVKQNMFDRLVQSVAFKSDMSLVNLSDTPGSLGAPGKYLTRVGTSRETQWASLEGNSTEVFLAVASNTFGLSGGSGTALDMTSGWAADYDPGNRVTEGLPANGGGIAFTNKGVYRISCTFEYSSASVATEQWEYVTVALKNSVAGFGTTMITMTAPNSFNHNIVHANPNDNNFGWGMSQLFYVSTRDNSFYPRFTKYIGNNAGGSLTNNAAIIAYYSVEQVVIE